VPFMYYAQAENLTELCSPIPRQIRSKGLSKDPVQKTAVVQIKMRCPVETSSRWTARTRRGVAACPSSPRTPRKGKVPPPKMVPQDGTAMRRAIRDC
jgi:hypothetical protein